MGIQTGRYFAFEMAVARDAWSRTWRTLQPKREHLLLETAVFVAGALLTWWLRGTDVASSTVAEAVVGGVLAVVAVFVLLLAWNLIAAPYRLWRSELHARTALETKRASRQDLVEIARAVERCVRDGEEILKRSGYVDEVVFINWFYDALNEVAKCGDQERSMFKSFRYASGFDPVGDVTMRRAIEKLRRIMARAYAKAEGNGAS